MNPAISKAAENVSNKHIKMTKKKTTERTKEIIRLLQEGEE
jgi:DNA-binding NarL/FixJ family response regulator